MNDKIVINVGTMSSWNSLYRNIAPKLDILRKYFKAGKKPNIVWDFSYIQSGRVNMAALTAFLSIANSIRKQYDYPTPFDMDWNPNMLRFLSDINFFKIAKELDILQWHPNLLGGLINPSTNPNSKILYFSDVPDRDYLIKNITKLNDWKETKREQLIVEELYGRIDSLLFYEIIEDDWKQQLINTMSMTVAELIVNSLLHGQDTAFVGFQKSKKGITVCVCDSGIGFLSSMKKNQTWVQNLKMEKDIDALMNASLMTTDNIGLRKAIDDIIKSNGYIILSSVDCELRWERNNWEKANKNFDFKNFTTNLQSAKEILGEEVNVFENPNEIMKGFYRNFNSKLKGTRVTFELPSKK